VERAGRGGKVARIALGALAAVVLVLVLAQLFLPGIAASRVRGRVERYGTVRSVSVTAWPAVELLWGKAETVEVRAGSLTLSKAQTAKLLKEARGAGSVHASAERVKVGPLQLYDASLHKHGDALSASAWASRADVQTALGEGLEAQLLDGGGGRVRMSVEGGLFGVKTSVEAVAEAQGGNVVVHPLGFLLEGLKLTLFAEPGVYVESVGASAAAGPSGQGAGYRLSLRGTLR
jgi:hypothetical protein